MKNKRLGFFSKILILVAFAGSCNSLSAAEKRDYFEIKVYKLTTNEQVKKVDEFLEIAYLPALHKAGIPKIGVFHPIGNDTAVDKKIYVFIPIRSLEKLSVVEDLLLTDPELIKAGNDYWNTAFDKAAYQRIETIVLKAFPLMTGFSVPNLSGNKTDRVYELRSYEGATEKLYRQKVKMFNEGGEIALFKRLNFNAVFYAEVVAGSHQPNLMYMTSFNSRADRDEHWKQFVADPEWVKLKAIPEYLNTVSKNEQLLLNPASFSEL
ncbi:MAG: hypothetical protein RLZZ28_302 [Bacteroidota bacterium]|jgi:hypothetical protein